MSYATEIAKATIDYGGNDGAGATVEDRSGNANNGTWLGTPAYTTGPFGAATALDLDGTNGVATGFTDSGTEFRMHVELWFKTTAAGGTQTLFGSYTSSSSPNSRISIVHNSGGTENLFRFSVTESAFRDTIREVTIAGANDGFWHHLLMYCFIGVPNVMQVWFDGVEQTLNAIESNSNGTLDDFPDAPYVGVLNAAGSPANYFVGQIDELRLYFGESSLDVAALFAGPPAAGPTFTDPGTAALDGDTLHWGGSGSSTAADWDDGGDAISSYAVTVKQDGVAVGSPAQALSGSLDISGFGAGDYTVEQSATNADGTSAVATTPAVTYSPPPPPGGSTLLLVRRSN